MLSKVIKHFNVKGEYVDAIPYGCGHINDSYAVTMNDDGNIYRLFVQRINHHIFTDVESLMNNIEYVTSYIKSELKKENKDDLKECLTLIKTLDNKNYYYDEINDMYYRIYVFIEDTITYQIVSNNEVFYECGKSFGKFQHYLACCDPSFIKDSIKDFHNTPKRYNDFIKACELDKIKRLDLVKAEVEFVKVRFNDCHIIYDKLINKELPIRITHNDTKLNNILMDPISNKGICVVDLDTIMQGSVLYDIGDSLRFGCNTAPEDETDLDLVHFDESLFKSYVKGFLEETIDSLTKEEIELIPFSAKLMTFECGIRFLTDYLDGDNYFKIKHPNHNLDRARTQFKLVLEIEQKMPILKSIVKELL